MSAFTPREGMHSMRIPIVDLAAVDVLGTVAIAWVLARAGRWSFWTTLAVLVAAGIVVHWWLDIPTTLNLALGLN